MNHLDFLDTAKKLISTDSPTEADIRSAISRAYYAVYHHVLLWWKSNEKFPDYKDRGHAKIQMALFNAGVRVVRNFSRTFQMLNSYRQKADYELAFEFDFDDGQSILDLACNAITDFDAIDKNVLYDGIEDYLRKTNQI